MMLTNKKYSLVSKHPEQLEAYPKVRTYSPLQCMTKLQQLWVDLYDKGHPICDGGFVFKEVDANIIQFVVRLERRQLDGVTVVYDRKYALYDRIVKHIVNPETGVICVVLKAVCGPNSNCFDLSHLEGYALDVLVLDSIDTDIRGVEVDGTMLWTADKQVLWDMNHIETTLRVYKGKLKTLMDKVS